MLDYALLLGGFLLSISFALIWLFYAGQDRLEKSAWNVIAIILRISVLYVLLAGCLHFWVGVPLRAVAWLGIGAPFLVVFLHAPFADSIETAIFSVVFLVPAYAIRYFVLGLSFKDEFDREFRNTELEKPLPKADEQYVSQTGLVTAPLRPLGEIRIGDVTLTAKSHDGSMIDVDTQVMVTGVSGKTQIVKASEQNSSDES